MKKTLLAMAVGAAFAAPAAYADVTISGAINMGIEYHNVDGGEVSGADSVGNFGIANNYSNITISSIDDLGGGLKLDFALQVQLAPGSAGDALSNRNSRIGLVSDSWGGIYYGTNEHIYERYLYQIDPLDGAAGLGGNLQILGTPRDQVFGLYGSPESGYSFYRRDGHSLWYDSPSFGGFTFGVVWQMDFNAENDHPSGSGSQDVDRNPMMFQLGGKYVGSGLPLEAWAAIAYRKDQFGLDAIGVANSESSTDVGMHAGVAYTLGDIKIFGGYENVSYESDLVGGGDADWDRDAFYVGLKWNLASGYVGAQYIVAMEADCGGSLSGACDDTGAQMIGVGYYHTMSKQTQLYVVGSWLDNDDAGTYSLAGIGNDNNGLAGSRAYGIGVGIKHTF